MRRHVLPLLLIAAVVGLVIVACSVENRIIKKAKDLQEELCKEASDFNRMVAWGYWDEAAQMVVPDRRGEFLMQAEKVATHLKMEGYKIAMCQVSSFPYPRVRGEVTPTPTPVPTPTPTPTPRPPADQAPSPTPKPEMPKVWYGLVLVRYINVSVVPSNAVRSPLLRQYWVWKDDYWMVDPDLTDLTQLPPQ